MNIGDRIKRRLTDQQLSQSELARRVGVRQSTINSLIHGDSYGSKHLHRIARELHTTPAYLTGEVDDPDLDAPEPPILTSEQTAWLAIFDALDPPNRSALMQIGRTMVTGMNQPTVNSPKSAHPGKG